MIANDALLTDLYQLAMMQGYYDQRMQETAVFELFVRRLPASRSFLVAAGLEQAIDYLQNLRFTSAELDWLQGTGFFNTDFLQWLENFRFTGDVHAMAEGTVFFPNEPILRITAPIAEAQFVESRLINILHFQTLIASKAARSVLLAPDKKLIEFGFRRAHGGEAGLLAARASYLAGFSGTATVAAGRHFGIPVFGTMAHSFIQAHRSESEAFEHFALANLRNVVLLIDTYDTEAGAQKVVELAPKLKALGIPIKGVRLDSGDLASHARHVREILDAAGLADTTIFASGNIDEYSLEKLILERAPIDGFGIGTHLDTSEDAPYLDCAYKLQQYAGIPRRKRSEGKATWPGVKQVYRRFDADGLLTDDTITLVDAPCTGGPLLKAIMLGGELVETLPTLERIRLYAEDQLNRLPENLRVLKNAQPYPVRISAELCALTESMDKNQ
ncbi:nicotinate phosphoribosyltransferase [Methylomicrobium sp. Wu6]|uniref:nicotinate phosphoribosyltransferase n=1 Tax=Methylomicrobium sp. Wu6 TaxID=3107928 RepID=UPI002DD62E96|nr:nicotinate phosphoribosyltransferase [Methylomicrobium sp. Wu6]MEC4747867.1 nicotinate phosphoribosyltransferase [Methylomicrobium sp. Wu6]